MPKLSVLIDARPAEAGAQAVRVAFQSMKADVQSSASAMAKAEADFAKSIKEARDAETQAADAFKASRKKRSDSASSLADIERQLTRGLIADGATVKSLEEDITRTVIAEGKKREKAFRDSAKASSERAAPGSPGARPGGASGVDLDALRRQAAAAQNTARQIAGIGEAAIGRLGPAAGVVRSLTDQFGGLERGLEKTALQSGLTGSALIGIGAGAAAVAALGTGLAYAAAQGLELERSLDKTRALIDPSVAGFDDLAAAALRLSSTSGVSRLEETAALAEVLTSGYSKQADVVQILAVATDLARTKLVGISDAVKVVDANLDVYGIKVSQARKASEQLFVASRIGETDFRTFADAVAEVGKVASPLGIGLDEVAAVMSTVAKRGVPVSEAVGGMSRVLLSLQNELDPTNQKLRALGVDASTSGVAARGLVGTLEDISAAVKRTGDSRDALVQLFGSARVAGAALAAIGDGAGQTADALAKIRGGADEVTAAIDRVNKSSTKQLQDALNEAKNGVADLGRTALEFASKGIIAYFGGVANNIKSVAGKVVVETVKTLGNVPIPTSLFDQVEKAASQIKTPSIDVDFKFPDAAVARESVAEGLTGVIDAVKRADATVKLKVAPPAEDEVHRQIKKAIQSLDSSELDVPVTLRAPEPASVQAARDVLAKLQTKREPLFTPTDTRELRDALATVSEYTKAQNDAFTLSQQLSLQSASAADREVLSEEQAFRAIERQIAARKKEGVGIEEIVGLEGLLKTARERAATVRTDKRHLEEVRAAQSILDLEVQIAEKRADALRLSPASGDARAAIAADLAARELSISAAIDKSSQAVREQLKDRADLSSELDRQLAQIQEHGRLEREIARTTAARSSSDLFKAELANVNALDAALIELQNRPPPSIDPTEIQRTLRLQETYGHLLSDSTDNLNDQATASEILRAVDRKRLTEELALLEATKDEQEDILALYDKQSAKQRAITAGRASDQQKQGKFNLTPEEISVKAANQTVAEGFTEGTAEFTKRFEQLRDEIILTQGVTQAFGDSARSSIDGLILGTESLSDAFRNVGLAIQKELIDRLIAIPVSSFLSDLFGSNFGAAIGSSVEVAGGGTGGASAKGNAFNQSGLIPFARGDVFGAPPLTRFAAGDIFDAPTRFGFGGGKAGVLGEAGPEAVAPLKRGSDGKLGIAITGDARGGSQTVVNNYTTSVSMNVRTPNADSFRKSKSQIVRDLQRAARRG